MRQIDFQTVTLEGGEIFSYKAQLLQMLKFRPVEGIQIEEMVEAARVMGIIKKANGKVLLEEADYDRVIERLTAWRWGAVDEAIIQFDAALRQAPKVDPNET